MTALNKVEFLVLETAADPKCGLFEIVWTLNVQQPDWEPIVRVERAKAAVQTLIEKGYVELHRGHWDREEELGMYPIEELPEIVRDPYVWQRPDQGWYVIIKLTPAGKAAWYK